MLHWAGRSAETQPVFPSPPFCYHSDLGNSRRWSGCQSSGKLIGEGKKEREREGKERGRRQWIRMGMREGVTTSWIQFCNPQIYVCSTIIPYLHELRWREWSHLYFPFVFMYYPLLYVFFFHVSLYFLPSRDAQPKHFHPLLCLAALLWIFSL